MGGSSSADLLSSDEGQRDFTNQVSWCHGLPSIALGRVLSLDVLRDDECGAEIDDGAYAIMEATRSADIGLCHGVVGNADLLAIFSQARGVGAWHERSAEELGRAIASIERLDREFRLPVYGQFTGLFRGLAGLGWGMLRFGDPEVPSILTLPRP